MKNLLVHFSKIASLLTIILASIVLAGWFLNIPLLTTGFFKEVSMRFNPAICFILLGIIVYLIDVPELNAFRKKIVVVLLMIVFITGLLTASEFIFGWNIGIDELLWKDRLTAMHGRMGLVAAINFVIISITFFLLLTKRKHFLAIQIFLLIIFVISLFVIINNYFGYNFFSDFSTLNHISYLSSILFLLLISAIISNKQYDIRTFTYSRTLFGSFTSIGLFLFTIFYANNINNKKRIESTKLVEHTQEVLFTSHELRMDIYNIQNKTEEHIISGERNYLSDIGLLKESINRKTEKLLFLTTDNARQKPRLDSINALAERYMATRVGIINTFQQNGFVNGQKIFLADNGKLLMDKINSIFTSFTQEENQLLVTRKAENEEFINNSSKIIFLFIFIIFLLLVGIVIMIYNNQLYRIIHEKKLKQNLTLTTAILESIHNGILVVDQTGDVIKYNKQYAKMWRIPNELIESKNAQKLKEYIIDQLIYPNQFASKDDILQREENDKNLDLIYLKDGRIFQRKLKPMQLENNAIGRVWSYMDITTYKKAEDEKIYQLSRYKTLMDTSQDAIHILDESGKLLEWNSAFVKHLGYSEDEMAGFHLWNWDKQWNKEELLKILSESDTEGKIVETLHKTKDGSLKNVEIRFQKIFLDNKNIIYSSAIDITERKQLEREREQFFKFFNITSDLMVIADPVGCFKKINPAGLATLGYSEEELLSKSFIDFIHPDDRQSTLDEMANQMKTSRSMNFENRYLCKDGSTKILSWRANYVAVEGITYATARDITESKKIDEKYRSILDTTNDGFYMVDFEGRIIDTNDSYCRMIGYSRDELLKMGVKDIDVIDSEEQIKQRIQQIMKTGYAFFETKHRKKDGEIISIEASCGYSDFDKEELFVFMRDITDRKLAEDEIKKQNRINKFIGEINKLILLAKTEDDIYNGICKIAIETGNFVFAWIGIPNLVTKTIQPIARAGNEDGYLNDKVVSTEDIVSGRGPTGKAYREAKYYYCNDIENDPVMKTWSKNAIEHGFYSSIAIPLIVDNKVVSTYTMYANKANFFTEGELELLVRVTKNIGYALNAISNNKKRIETEIQLNTIK